MGEAFVDLRRDTVERAFEMLSVQADRKLPGAFRDPNQFPKNSDAFELLLRAAYWASYEKNEGRQLAFSLVLIPPERLPKEPLVVFESPIGLTKESVVALAPIAERSFGLGVAEIGDEYVIWGLLLRPVPAVSLKVIEPGSLLVRLDYENALVVTRAECFLTGAGAAQVARILAQGLSAGVSESHRVVAGALLLQIADGIRRHLNGGTVVIVPSGNDSWTAGLKIRQRLKTFIALERKLDDYVRQIEAGREKASAWTPTDARYRSWFALPLVRDLDEYLRGDYSAVAADLQRLVGGIAGLTSVDGAVVVTDRLEVLGFSAVLDATPHEEHIAVWTLPSILADREPVDRSVDDLGGTRHRAAARFVAAFPDCVALVVSHDGPVSFVATDTDRGRTLVITRLELLLDRYW
jgi:hypothetical protein